ncbi:MAG: DoxX-like family protein [Acidobacteriaceae bacterium]
MSALALLLPSLLWMRVSIALVWLYEGLWCKVMGMMPSQLAIVTELPGFSRERALLLWKSVGAVEIFLGLWVLTGVHPGWCALAEVVLLMVMNANALLWARHLVFDPVGMVLKNVAFLMLVWVAGAMAVRR